MKPAQFELHRPDTLEQALELLANYDFDARIIAGGQSLMPLMNLRMVGFSHLIDLNRIEGMSDIRLDDEGVRIGAMARQQDLFNHPVILKHTPLIAAALPYIGHIQTRNRGTVGGSLAHADPSAELPLTMVTLDAKFIVTSRKGSREIAARHFFTDVLSTDLASDEILTEVVIPAAPVGARVHFHEFGRRHGDFALAACAAQYAVYPEGGRLAVGLGGVDATPYFCEELSDRMSTGKSALSQLGQHIENELKKLNPLSDLQADEDYRRTLAAVLLADCLREVLQ
ncbi:FAD binding domain-containing protein [Eoetvoesiella caeni]